MRGSAVDNYTLFKHDNIPCNELDIGHNVRGYDNDFVKRDFGDVVTYCDTLLRVKSCRRFVEYQYLR